MNNSSCYLSERTANALVSDLRPVKISDQALEYINLILDEILCSLIAKAESINPRDLKLKGIPAVFSAESSSTPTPTKTHFRIPSHGHRRSTSGFGSNSNINPLSTAPSPHEAGSRTLGRDAVNEAELELTAWNAARDQAKREDAFLKNARGLVPSIGAEAPFPIREAVDLLRLKVSAYSTLASQDINTQVDRELIRAWAAAGGCIAQDVLAPAALYLTAIIEHVCERILTNLGLIVTRNTNTSEVGLEDLYSSLCEEDTLWGFFKNFQVRKTLETEIPANAVTRRGRQDEFQPTSEADVLRRVATSSPISSGPVSNGGRGMSLDLRSSPSKSSLNRAFVQSRMSADLSGPVGVSGFRDISPTKTGAKTALNRSTSNLPRVSDDLTYEGSLRSSKEDSKMAKEEEFDALLNSGQTMKVSLTPSRLKNFDRNRSGLNSLGTTSKPFDSSTRSPSLLQKASPLMRSGTNSSHSDNSRLRSSSVSASSVPQSNLAPRAFSKGLSLTSPGASTTSKLPVLGETISSPEGTQAKPPWGEQARSAATPFVRMQTQASTEQAHGESSRSGASPDTKVNGNRENLVFSPQRKVARKAFTNREVRDASSSMVSTDGDSDRDAGELGQPRRKSSTAELADFLNNTAPPLSMEPVDVVQSSPTRKKSDTAELAEFLTTTAPPEDSSANVKPRSSPRPKSGRFKSMVARVVGKGSHSAEMAPRDPANNGLYNSLERSDTETSRDLSRSDSLIPSSTRRDISPKPPLDDSAHETSVKGSPTLEPTIADPLKQVDGQLISPDAPVPQTVKIARHQILVVDFSPSSESEKFGGQLSQDLKQILFPFYTVGIISAKSLRQEPWEPACALLVIYSHSSDYSPDVSIQNRLSTYIHAGGNIWAVGPICKLFCEQSTRLERPLIQDKHLYPGKFVTVTRSTNSTDLTKSGIPLKSSGSMSWLTPDQETRSSYITALDSIILSDGSLAVLSSSLTFASSKLVLWPTDTTTAAADDFNLTPVYTRTLALFDISPIPSATLAAVHARWSSLPASLLQPKHPLPLFLLAHPDLEGNLPDRILNTDEVAENITKGSVDIGDSLTIRSRRLKDNNNTFDIVDLNSTDIDVIKIMKRQREALPDESGSKDALSILFPTSSNPGPASWRPDWTPLFDFGLYWSELKKYGGMQGLRRASSVSTANGGLGQWNMGDVIQYGEAVGSTQTMLDKNPILLYGLPTPFLSLATFQLAGRGRGKNQWLSPPGCLQFSLLLKLPRGFPANKVVFAQYIAALAICQGLDEDGKLGVRIKWPNDIYAEAAGIGSDNAEQALDSNGRPKKSRSKLGGILVNSSYVKGEWHLVVGCGINILNDLPTTSLAQLHELRQKQHSSTQKAVLAPTMESSLARILVAFEEIWTRFVAERSFASFIDEYTGRWLHTDQAVTLATVTPPLALTIKTLELDSGLLRCVRTDQEDSAWGSSYYGEAMSGAGGSLSQSYVDLQPDGNSFDLMTGMIKQKV